MKIALLSGAYKNAGDFLIEQRCIDLLKTHIKDCLIKVYKRNQNLIDIIEEINSYDAIIIGGGPAYSTDFYPGNVRLLDDIKSIKVPIFTLGLGWWGRDSSLSEISAHHFNETSKQLLERMSAAYPLSCRDWESYYVLKNAGLEAKMTGCVAWYNIPFIKTEHLIKRESKVICISDPANIKNHLYAMQLVEFLKEKYPDYTLRFIFHRGFGEKDNYTNNIQASSQEKLKIALQEKGCEIKDIAYGHEGFKEYDNCFMHIGFRVHAHIYNLSIRNKSILLSEDSRGEGVNNALGLPTVRTYKRMEIGRLNRIYYKYMNKFGANKYVIRDLENIMAQIDEAEAILYNSAFLKMQSYYNEMIEFIKGIENSLKK